MELSRKGDSIDKRLCSLISFSFLLVAINRVATLPFAEHFQQVIAVAQWGIYVFLFIGVLKPLIERCGKLFFRSYGLFIILYMWSCVYSLLREMPVDLLLTHEVVWTLGFFLPVGLATYAIYDYKVLYASLYKISYLISLLCIFYSVYRMFINPFGNSYDMAFGYILLVPALFHYSEFRKSHNIIALFVLLIEVVFLLLFGSRGVVIGLVSYMFLDMFFKLKTNLQKLKLIIPIIALFLVYIELPKINDYLESQNIYSRTLIKIATGDEDDDTHGRTNHWSVGLDLISERPILGYGLGGYYYDFHEAISKKHPDELYTYDLEKGEWMTSTASVSGAHSGFIDMSLYFGIFIGIPLAIWLLFSFIRIGKINNIDILELTLIFYCSYILGNMIVGSGIFTKPGCAIFLFIMLKLKTHPHLMKRTAVSNK